MIIIGAVLLLLVPYLIYRYILKGNERTDKKKYLKTFLLGATLYTIPIIILEVIWDRIFGAEARNIAQGLAHSFARAALIEEGVKYYFSYRILRKYKELGMKESILLVGVIGIAYGFTEKLVFFNPFAMLVNAVVPGHMVFQWVMGYYLYQALRTDGQEKKKFLLLAFLLPFAIHGAWDAILFIVEFCIEMDGIMSLIGVLLPVFMVVFMIVFTIKLMKYIKRIED